MIMRVRRKKGALFLTLCCLLLVLGAGGFFVFTALGGDLLLSSLTIEDMTPTLKSAETTLQKAFDEMSGPQSVEAEAKTVRAGAFSVHAKATLAPMGTLQSMTCEVYSAGSGEKLLSETTDQTEKEWALSAEEKELKIVVTATTESGKQRSQELSFENNAPAERFIWPIELTAKPLIHDYYLVKTGASKFAGLTHNNGKMRIRHYVQIRGREHFGFDITAPSDTEIRAAAAGRVVFAGSSSSDGTDSSDYGKYLTIEHDERYEGQKVYTLYAHVNTMKVKNGDRVEQGDIVALSGNTGGSRIPHCHLEFRIGINKHSNNVDPLELLPERDFDALPDTLPGDSYPASSVDLYNSVRDKQWDFVVRAKTRVAVSGVPAGTVVTLTNRTKSATTFSYKGKIYSCKLTNLIYTF